MSDTANTRSFFKLFESDDDLEQKGIVVQYDSVRFIVARAGGSNARYQKTFSRLSKPHRQRIQRGRMSIEQQTKLLAQTYAEAVIKRVDVLKPEADAKNPAESDWVQNQLPDETLGTIPFDKGKLADLLIAMPDLFEDLRFMASQVEHYQSAADEGDEGN